MNLAVWILAMVQPLIGRILVSLGMSVVTITGFTFAVAAVKQSFIGSVNALPVDILNLFLLSGGGIACGMVLGAVTTRVLITQISNSTKILGVNNG
jgi:cell division protein FtsX